MLRNRFVCGIAHPTVQKRLLAESDLILTKAVIVAQTIELAEKGAQQLQLSVDKETKEVHKFSTTNSHSHVMIPRKKMVLHVVRHLAPPITNVMESTTNKPVDSSPKPVVFAINVVTLPKCAGATNASLHQLNLLIRQHRIHLKVFLPVYLAKPSQLKL